MQTKKLFNIAQKIIFLTTIILLFLIRIPIAQSEIVTEQNLRDAILKNGGNFTEEQLKEMDQNNDGKLDVSDLVHLVRTVPQSTPTASFQSFTSDIEEGTETANIKVNFSNAFSGTLRYTLSGTATSGTDYEMSENSVSVDGLYVNISVIINDDNILEDNAETILITLNEGAGYVPGASTTHTLYLYDNDALWNGTIETNGTALHFQMKIIQTPTKTTGALFTDGYGIIPLNGGSQEWIANSISLTSTLFSATVDQIEIPKSLILANADMKRKFVFQAKSQQGDIVQPDAEITGKIEEFVTCSSAKQFEYHTVGTFTLLRPIPNIEIPSLTLEDVE